MFARFVAKLFAPATRTPIRNARRTHLNAESLEARDVPASYFWHPTSGSSAALAANWISPDAPGTVPGNGADVYFANSKAGSTASCDNFGLASGAFNSVNVTLGYPGTVTVSQGFETEILELHDGAISQPSSGTDITVTDVFNWSDGDLNSSGNLANVYLDSATGLISPVNEGSVTLGSNLRPEDGTNLTINPGTINLTNVARLLAEDSAITVPASTTGNPTVLAGQPQLGDPPNRLAGATGYLHLNNAFLSNSPWLVDGGTLKITNGKTAEFQGFVAGVGTASLDLSGATGKIQIENGSTLKVQNGVLLSGGKLSTLVGVPDTIAIIEGKVTNSGADVVICDGSSPHVYGRLKVVGTVSFTGGTYRPVINAGVDGTADRWYSTGNFTIGGAAKLAIGALNLPPNGPVAGGTWVIIESTTGTVAGLFQNITWPQLLQNCYLDNNANPATQYRVRWPAV